MTQAEAVPIEERFAQSGIGLDQLMVAHQKSTDVESLARKLGIKSLSALIALVICEHYPADIFPPADKQYGVTWRADMDNGPGLDPGVKWIALLRMALEEVAGAEPG